MSTSEQSTGRFSSSGGGRLQAQLLFSSPTATCPFYLPPGGSHGRRESSTSESVYLRSGIMHLPDLRASFRGECGLFSCKPGTYKQLYCTGAGGKYMGVFVLHPSCRCIYHPSPYNRLMFRVMAAFSALRVYALSSGKYHWALLTLLLSLSPSLFALVNKII